MRHTVQHNIDKKIRQTVRNQGSTEEGGEYGSAKNNNTD